MKQFIDFIPLLLFFIVYKLDPRVIDIAGHELTVGGIYSATAVLIISSVVVYGAIESRLTPLMLTIEQRHPTVKVFSLPSVDHPEHGKHIELGVKGRAEVLDAAFADLLAGLHEVGASLGPESVRN